MKRGIISCFIVLFLSISFAYAQENPLENIRETPGMCSIFHRWGFIGDSLSSGEFEYKKEDGKTSYVDIFEYSWGQRMCASMGVTGINYSKGGETAKAWIKNFWDTPVDPGHRDAKKTPQQVYVIALGCNETNARIPSGNVDTDVNLQDYNQNNVNTFAGAYAGIIQRVRSIQPDCRIFVVTRPRDGHMVEDYNVQIRRMAELFERTYLIDLEKYAPDYSEGTDFHSRYYMGGHLNAAGYQYTAYMMMTYIDWIIRNNPGDFDDVAFIGTRYKAR